MLAMANQNVASMERHLLLVVLRLVSLTGPTTSSRLGETKTLTSEDMDVIQVITALGEPPNRCPVLLDPTTGSGEPKTGKTVC